MRAQVHYRAIYYYLDEHPELLVDLLNTLQSRVDHARVVELVRKAGHLPLIKEYLLAVQKNNVSEVGGWVGGCSGLTYPAVFFVSRVFVFLGF